jgi:hypothetical protein
MSVGQRPDSNPLRDLTEASAASRQPAAEPALDVLAGELVQLLDLLGEVDAAPDILDRGLQEILNRLVFERDVRAACRLLGLF